MWAVESLSARSPRGIGVRVFGTDPAVRRRVLPTFLGLAHVAAAGPIVGIVIGAGSLIVLAGMGMMICLITSACVASSIATVTVGDGRIHLGRCSGRHLVLDLDDLQGLQGPFISGMRGLTRTSLLVLRRRGTGRRIMLAGGPWNQRSLDELASELGVEVATGYLDAWD